MIGHLFVKHATRLLEGLQALQLHLKILLEDRDLTVADLGGCPEVCSYFRLLCLDFKLLKLGLCLTDALEHLLLILPLEFEL